MRYMLDANIIIRMLSFPSDALLDRLAQCDEDEIATSAIAFGEVALGSNNGKPPPEERLRAFLDEVPVLPFDRTAADHYAKLPFKRGSYDRLIAAHALSAGLILVSDNVAHFADIPGLAVENWTTDAP